MVQLGKLNPDQILTEVIQSILDIINLATRVKKMICPVRSTVDIFAMPMSYVFNLEERVFFFIVHIPHLSVQNR